MAQYMRHTTDSDQTNARHRDRPIRESQNGCTEILDLRGVPAWTKGRSEVERHVVHMVLALRSWVISPRLLPPRQVCTVGDPNYRFTQRPTGLVVT